MPSWSQRPQCIAQPSEPPSYVQNMKSYVETTFLQSALHARGWAVTLMEENQGDQRSLTSAGLEGKLSFSLSFQYFGSPGQKECLLLPVFTRFSVEWTHWFPTACPKRREKSKITSACSHLAVTRPWAQGVQADSQISSFISLLPFCPLMQIYLCKCFLKQQPITFKCFPDHPLVSPACLFSTVRAALDLRVI